MIQENSDALLTGKANSLKSVKNDILPPTVIYKYFNKIFNSYKTKSNPTICDIKNINELIARCPSSNSQGEKMELDYASKNIGKGVSFDGISSDILQLLPDNLCECVLKYFN